MLTFLKTRAPKNEALHLSHYKIIYKPCYFKFEDGTFTPIIISY